MPYYQFIWTPENIAHIAEHGITQDEFEEVVMDPDQETTSRSSGLPAVYGWTSSGKYLFCVYDLMDDEFTLIPVTAYEVE